MFLINRAPIPCRSPWVRQTDAPEPSTLAQSCGLWWPKNIFNDKYCGLCSSAPLLPIDTLDVACARHDTCSPVGRLPSKACNKRLQWDTDRISRDPRRLDNVRALADFVSAGAALVPFDPNVPVAAARILAALRYGAPPNPSYRRSTKNNANIRMRHQLLVPTRRRCGNVCAGLRSSTRQTILWSCMPGS